MSPLLLKTITYPKGPKDPRIRYLGLGFWTLRIPAGLPLEVPFERTFGEQGGLSRLRLHAEGPQEVFGVWGLGSGGLRFRVGV